MFPELCEVATEAQAQARAPGELSVHIPSPPPCAWERGPSEVKPRVFLGSAKDSADRAALAARNITHVVNVATECTNHFPDAVAYANFAFLDHEVPSARERAGHPSPPPSLHAGPGPLDPPRRGGAVRRRGARVRGRGARALLRGRVALGDGGARLPRGALRHAAQGRLRARAQLPPGHRAQRRLPPPARHARDQGFPLRAARRPHPPSQVRGSCSLREDTYGPLIKAAREAAAA